MNIKQASEYTGISRDMIRFYEKKGIIHPARKNNGYRDYSSHDLLLLVTARQYSCLGIELDTISELLKQNDSEVFYNEMEQAVSRLKEEQLRLLQQMDYAENMKSIFRMARNRSRDRQARGALLLPEDGRQVFRGSVCVQQRTACIPDPE